MHGKNTINESWREENFYILLFSAPPFVPSATEQAELLLCKIKEQYFSKITFLSYSFFFLLASL